MVQKPWFKVFAWFMATFFFFLTSSVIISMLRPGPSENDVMKFMMGMMGAMENSIMGISMSIESSGSLKEIIVLSYTSLVPIMAISIVAGFIIRALNGGKKDVR